MAKITRFEDLICWRKAKSLVNLIYGLTKEGPFSRDYPLRDQIRRAAISSMTNIAEGFSRFHKKDFIRFLDISQSSTEEVKSLLYIALDQEYLTKEIFTELEILISDTKQTTLGLLRHVKSIIETKSNKVREPKTEYKTKLSDGFVDLPEEFIHAKIINSETLTL